MEYEYSDEEDGAKKATSVPRSLRTHDDAMFVRRAACGVIFMVDSKRVGISFESLVLRVGGVGLLPTVSVYTMIQEHVQVNKEFTASGQLNDASRINAVERPQRWTLLTERGLFRWRRESTQAFLIILLQLSWLMVRSKTCEWRRCSET